MSCSCWYSTCTYSLLYLVLRTSTTYRDFSVSFAVSSAAGPTPSPQRHVPPRIPPAVPLQSGLQRRCLPQLTSSGTMRAGGAFGETTRRTLEYSLERRRAAEEALAQVAPAREAAASRAWARGEPWRQNTMSSLSRSSSSAACRSSSRNTVLAASPPSTMTHE